MRLPMSRRRLAVLAALLGSLLAAAPAHAIVGGATRSGKTEFLLTWLTALCLANSPDDLAIFVADFAALDPQTPARRYGDPADRGNHVVNLGFGYVWGGVGIRPGTAPAKP
jgi:hypothetical protein